MTVDTATLGSSRALVPNRSRTASSSAVGGSSRGVDSALNDRVRLYLKVTTLINVFFTAVGLVMWLSGLDPNLETRGPTVVGHLTMLTCFNALGWAFIAQRRPRFVTALVTQAVMTIALNAAYARLILGPHAAIDSGSVVFTVLLTTIVLTLRSVLVPSPTVASVASGTISFVIVFTIALVAETVLPMLALLWAGISSVVVVGVTALASHTIYGLDRRARAAARLGQYQLVRRLGYGSMGEVYLGTHALLNRSTAIKLLSDASTSASRDRFQHEVRTASTLTHPNTVEIYDYGRTPDGVFYFAMEYVEGATLEQVVRATGVMSPARVVHLLLQACSALGEAHEKGLVHRDVKPSNLMLCERGGVYDTLKVLDFGLVRELGSESLSETGLTGTPLYLAPEAIVDGDAFAAESDVYAIGATAYFLLTARPPFYDGDLVDVLSDHLATEPASVESDDAKLNELVMRCLAKDPADRPENARALVAELRQCESFGVWTDDDARVWWTEHKSIVESAPDSDSASQPGDSSVGDSGCAWS